MTNKENNQNNGNTSKASNKSKKGFRYYRNRSNNKSVSGSSNKQQAKKEYTFHMLDSQARKNSESFDKIKKFIVLKIQETFDDSLDVVESLESKRKKKFTKPKMERSQIEDEVERKFEQEQLYEEWKIDYEMYKKDQKSLMKTWLKLTP